MRSFILALTLVVGMPVAFAQQGPPTPAAPTVSTTVTLIRAGEHAEQPLRHHFEAGQTQDVRIRVQARTTMSMMGRSQSMPMPILRLDLRLGPTTVTEDGDLGFGFEVTDVGVSGADNPQIRERVEQLVRSLVGVTGHTEVTDRGEVTAFEYTLPANAPTEPRERAALEQQANLLRDSINQLLPRFPAEPVGVGAEWRVTDHVDMPGSGAVEVHMSYRLVSRQGDHIELAVRTDTVQGTDGQPANAASIVVNGSGRVRFVIGSLAVRGRRQTVSNARISGPRGEMNIEMRTRTQFTPR